MLKDRDNTFGKFRVRFQLSNDVRKFGWRNQEGVGTPERN